MAAESAETSPEPACGWLSLGKKNSKQQQPPRLTPCSVHSTSRAHESLINEKNEKQSFYVQASYEHSLLVKGHSDDQNTLRIAEDTFQCPKMLTGKKRFKTATTDSR